MFQGLNNQLWLSFFGGEERSKTEICLFDSGKLLDYLGISPPVETIKGLEIVIIVFISDLNMDLSLYFTSCRNYQRSGDSDNCVHLRLKYGPFSVFHLL